MPPPGQLEETATPTITCPVAAARAIHRSEADSGQRLAIPAYSYPYPRDAYWTQLLTGAPTLGMIVADPADGPGTRQDANYVAAIAAARHQDIAVLGYVTMSYGDRSRTEIELDIDRWYAWYAIDGIFIDLVPTSSEYVQLCRALYRKVKKRTTSAGLVVLNPGTQTSEAYMSVCDIILNNESTWATYRDAYPQPPAWINRYPAQRFWHLVHDCRAQQDMLAVVSLARARNAGWVFVTDRTGLNAYDVLPDQAYWTNELRQVGGGARR